MEHTIFIPTSRNHAGIIIGSKGSKIARINQTYNVFSKINNAQPDEGRPLPYFSVTGRKENVQDATIHIYQLLFQSTYNEEKKIKNTILYNNGIQQIDKIRIIELESTIEELKAEIKELQSTV
jgi:hypothetical protein